MQASDGTPQVVAFDDIRVEFDAHRLSKAGVTVALEPKAFAVLRTMLARPGHAFTRDELLDAVWGHRHVTPGVLVRVVGLIRKALNDDHERYLQTVHGVGYRFVLPEGTVQDALPETTMPAASGPARPTDTPAPPPTARRSPARAWRLGGLAACVAGLWLWTLAGDPQEVAAPLATQAPPSDPAPATLAVLPLRALGDDPRGQDFADGLSEELITALARIDGLRVSARSASFPYRDFGLPLPEVARRLGASHLLEGSVRQDGNRLRISLRLLDVAGDRALWTESFDRGLEDIFAVQAEIARAVADVLRLRLVLAADLPDEDPALYRRFLLARQLYYNAANSDLAAAEAAEATMRGLLAENPGFARGWGVLALLQYRRSLRPREGREALLADAERLAARALALDPGQPDALAVIAAQACREQRWSDCLAQSRRVVRLAPSDVGARQMLALQLASTARLDEAMTEIREAVAIDPASAAVQLTLGRLLDTQGRHADARVALERASPLRARTARMLNALWREDLADARRLAEAIPEDDHWRPSMLATVVALEDPRRWPAALAAIEASERTATPEGEKVDYNFMRMWLPERDFARDIAGLNHTQRTGFATYQLVFWQPQSRALRQSAPFQTYLRDSGLLEHWRQDGWPAICRPEGADSVRCD